MKFSKLQPNDTLIDLTNKYNSNFDKLEEYVMGLGIERKVEVFESTESQTWYKLTKGTYHQSTNSLVVYVGGSICVAGVDFVEATPDSFRLVTPPVKGTRVIAMYTVVPQILPNSASNTRSELIEKYNVLKEEVVELRKLVEKLINGGDNNA